jgi:outer membrane protein OmpA-like peptidoglycan-associated protein
MVKSAIFVVGLSLSAALLGTVPAMANDGSQLSAEQIGDIFKKQKTRGLVLAPTTATTTETATTTAATTTATAAATTVAAASEYTQLGEDETIAVQITFDFDSAALRGDQKGKLGNLCAAMQSADVGLFRIIGHTDASGSASYNERLSLLRAQEVKRHMVNECGISESKLEAIGVGEEFPSNTANPRADENRRVEFQALS